MPSSDAICLVEWPDRWGDVRPEDAALDLTPDCPLVMTPTGGFVSTWNTKWHGKKLMGMRKMDRTV